MIMDRQRRKNMGVTREKDLAYQHAKIIWRKPVKVEEMGKTSNRTSLANALRPLFLRYT